MFSMCEAIVDGQLRTGQVEVLRVARACSAACPSPPAGPPTLNSLRTGCSTKSVSTHDTCREGRGLGRPPVCPVWRGLHGGVYGARSVRRVCSFMTTTRSPAARVILASSHLSCTFYTEQKRRMK